MTDYPNDFYFGILAKLQNLVDSDGQVFALQRRFDRVHYKLAYEPRLDEYRHNYLRDNHLAKRDVVIIGRPTIGEDVPERNDRYAIVVSAKRMQDVATIYREALRYLYGENHEEALAYLHEMLSKFYEIKIEERSGYQQVDLSTGRTGNSQQINDLSRL